MIGILKPTKADTEPQDWTTGEIEQAKRLSRELIVQLFDEGKCSPVFFIPDGTNLIGLLKVFLETATIWVPARELLAQNNAFWAEVSGNDVFNVDIGRCVCLCRATGTPVPDFIENKNRRAK